MNTKRLLLLGGIILPTMLAGVAKADDGHIYKNKGHGKYCREYQKTVTIGNHIEKAYGTACLQPDGSWEMVSNADKPKFKKVKTVKAHKQPAVKKVVVEHVYPQRRVVRHRVVHHHGKPWRVAHHHRAAWHGPYGW